MGHAEPVSGVQCGGQMEPVGVITQAGGEWSLVHQCRQCNATQEHSIAVDDDGAALLTLASRRMNPAVVAATGNSASNRAVS